MNPRIALAIARKDFIDIWHNKTTLGGLLGPIFLSLVWLFVSHLAGSNTTKLLIYNPGNSRLAQIVEQAFPNADIVQASSAAEVQAAFGPNGANVKSAYAVGLSLPENFDVSLRSGNKPSLALYINGSTVDSQTEALLQTAIINFARTVANPQPPVAISTILINPPSTEKAVTIAEQVFLPLAMLASLIVGSSFIPLLLLEEKEKKTLRMLLVTPATFGDILAGKLLVVLGFQLATTCVVVAIMGGFTGEIPLILLYILLGAIFSMSLGLLLGSVLSSVQTSGTVSGFVGVIFILSGLFVGTLGQILSDSPLAKIARLIPAYYVAEGAMNASQNLGSVGSNLLDIGVALGSIIILLVISAWTLRRQSAVLALV